MNQKILPLTLAASLLLNGFFIGGYWFAQRKTAQLSSRKNRIEAVTRRLNLTTEQKKLFQKLKKQAWQIRKKHRKQARSLYHDLINQLAADTKRPGNTEPLVNEIATQQMRYQKKIIVLIQRFLDGLTDKQKKIFFKISSGNKQLNMLLSG